MTGAPAPLRVLMVEDAPDDGEIYLLATAHLLRAEGFHVDCAQGGDEALCLLEAQDYDVLVSDILMPGNPDMEMLKRIPARNAGLPVILATGYPSAQTAIQAIDLNVLAYLVKPAAFPDLLARVREGVAQRRVQRAVQASSRRVQDWAREWEDLATSLSRSSRAGVFSVQQMLGMILGRMGETLLDLKNLVDLSLADGESGTGTCPVLRCPRLEMYEALIREGIETLERTKSSFKSRELGDLRQRLEQMVQAQS